MKRAQQIGGVVLSMIAIACSASGQETDHHDWAAERWKAQWIAWSGTPQRDTGIFHFRKTIELRELPRQFVVHVSADNRFVLFVNGARVGEGPASSDLGHREHFYIARITCPNQLVQNGIQHRESGGCLRQGFRVKPVVEDAAGTHRRLDSPFHPLDSGTNGNYRSARS